MNSTKILKKISIYNFHTIKPIDEKEILTISQKYKYILTVEEHNIIGGLGSAVAEVLSSIKNNNSKLIRIGINDIYPPGGEYSYLINLLNLDSKSLYEKSKKLLKFKMENKYKEIFKGLSLNENQKVENLKYNEIDEWDSIGHMTLISELEEAFDISFDTSDIVNFLLTVKVKKFYQN